MKIVFLTLLFLLLTLGVKHSFADDISELKRRIITLEQAVYRDGKAPAAAIAPKESSDSYIKINQLEEEVRSLTGQVEELSYEIEKLRQNNSASVPAKRLTNDDLSQDFSEENPIYKNDNLTSSSLSNPTEMAYNNAFHLLQERKYEEASQAFANFIEEHTSHRLTANAHYWLGETYYVQKQFDKSALHFMDGYSLDKTGNKAPDNLLKLAMSLESMKKKVEACATYAKILDDFPKANINLIEQAKSHSKKIGC